MKKAFGLIFAIFLFNLATFRFYPTSGVDESWQSSNAISVFEKNFKSINHPFFLQNTGIPYLMNFALGLWYKIFGIGFIQGRLLIVILSTTLLVVFYKFVKTFFNEFTAFFAVLYFASTRVFLFSSRFIRNEVPFLIFLILSFWFFFKFLKNYKSKFLFFTGIFLGICAEFHQNVILLIISFIFSWFVINKLPRRVFLKDLLVFVGGLGLYCCYYITAHIIPNPNLYFFERSYSILKDHAMPIFSLTPKEMILNEANRYISYFYPLRMLELFLIIFSVFYGLRSKEKFLNFFSIFMFFYSFLFAFFSSNKTEVYLIYGFLLSSILMASAFLKLKDLVAYAGIILKRSDRKISCIPVIKFFYIFIFVILFNYFTNLYIIYENRDYNYGKVRSIISNQIPKEATVMGFTNYFLPLTHLKYRSFYVLCWHRIFNRYSVEESLIEIKPDYIIVDWQLEGALEDNEANITEIQFDKGIYKVPKKEFINFLNSNYKLVVSYNSDYYRNFKLYRRTRDFF